MSSEVATETSPLAKGGDNSKIKSGKQDQRGEKKEADEAAAMVNDELIVSFDCASQRLRVDFMTASQDTLTVDAERMREAEEEWKKTEEDQNERGDVALPEVKGFVTASGKNVPISEKELQRAKNAWKDIDDVMASEDSDLKELLTAERRVLEAKRRRLSGQDEDDAGNGVKRPRTQGESPDRRVRPKHEDEDKEEDEAAERGRLPLQPLHSAHTRPPPVSGGIPALGTPILRSGGVRRVGLSRMTPKSVTGSASPTLSVPRSLNKPFKPPTMVKSKEEDPFQGQLSKESLAFETEIMSGAYDDQMEKKPFCEDKEEAL